MLVVLIALGVICHAQTTNPDACEAKLANCQTDLGAVGANEAGDLVQLAAVITESGTPPSASKGALSRRHSRGMRGLHEHSRRGAVRVPVPRRTEGACRDEHERHGAAGRRRAVSAVECNALRSQASGVSSA